VTGPGIPFGRYGGVPVTVGPSWLLVVPIVGLALFAGIDTRLGETWERVFVAGFGTILLFASVLVHELGHTVAAIRRGITVERVVVFLFGGYSEMDLDGADPVDDIAVSLAGPIASAGLALATLVVALPAPEWAGMQRTLALLGIVNFGVALFNLLPGFPLDGGRMVRASLIGAGFEQRRADVITARLGIGLGMLAVAAGIWMTLRGDPAAIVALPVGVLVLVLAGAAHPRRAPEKT
jgi:Zn-dependent protease